MPEPLTVEQQLALYKQSAADGWAAAARLALELLEVEGRFLPVYLKSDLDESDRPE